jgi:hypothetical protein
MYPLPEIYSFWASAERTRASDRPAGASQPSTYHTDLAPPITGKYQPNPDRPDVCAHIQTHPDNRGQRPPRRTTEVPTHRTFSPRTLVRLDAQPRRQTRRDGRLG